MLAVLPTQWRLHSGAGWCSCKWLCPLRCSCSSCTLSSLASQVSLSLLAPCHTHVHTQGPAVIAHLHQALAHIAVAVTYRRLTGIAISTPGVSLSLLAKFGTARPQHGGLEGFLLKVDLSLVRRLPLSDCRQLKLPVNSTPSVTFDAIGSCTATLLQLQEDSLMPSLRPMHKGKTA